MKKVLYAIVVGTVVMLAGCGKNPEEQKLSSFIEKHLAEVKPLMKEAALSYWNAAISGKSEDYDAYSEKQLELKKIYNRRDEYAQLKELKESGKIEDPLLRRQLELLYNDYLSNQIDPDLMEKIVKLSADIEKEFSNFRGTIDGKKVTNNEIEEILKKETDSSKRRDAWLASKQVGAAVAPDIVKLVKMRNQGAQKLGFDNYHTLVLTTGEQDVAELDAIFEELYQLTQEPFAALKAELDEILAENYGIGVEGLMPWHYHDPFFQEAPQIYNVNLDEYYKDKDVKELAVKFYSSIGMNVESILANSDLYEKEGKNPHAFCTDIDREGDVRILCNLQNNERWMETMLHELGHAVYDKYHSEEVPFLLRQPAHTFTTEGIAMFFGRLSRNGAWMQEMLGLSDDQRQEIDEVSFKYARMKQLIFARWAMVMYNFEKELYANPDQDLNALWWDMVEKYQMVKRPKNRQEPDWAAKIHFTIAPCYYHNYLLGELFASQLHNHLYRQVLGLESDGNVSYVGEKAAGKFLIENVFEVGATLRWNEMIKAATGEPLTPQYFVQQFVK